MSEIKIQKRLTWLGLASLASTPITGPVGILGAVGIFSGKLLRLSWNDEARKNYEIEKKSAEKKEEIRLAHIPNYMHESPETAIARQAPITITRLLDKDSKRKRYNESLSIGAEVAKEYLRNLSPEEYSKIIGIEIYPEQKTTFTGRKSLEVKVKR